MPGHGPLHAGQPHAAPVAPARGPEAGIGRAIFIIPMLLGTIVIGLTLWRWGQPLVSRSGTIQLWVNSIWSPENSQQVADWYTLSHLIHGMAIAVIGRALHRWIGLPVLVAAAVITGVGWEIVEHTNWVLDQFRGQTIYQGYVGDTVLNAVCDYLFMLAGFVLALNIPAGWALAAMLALELTAALIARDSFILTTLRVVHPIQSISDWQDQTNPVTHPLP